MKEKLQYTNMNLFPEKFLNTNGNPVYVTNKVPDKTIQEKTKAHRIVVHDIQKAEPIKINSRFKFKNLESDTKTGPAMEFVASCCDGNEQDFKFDPNENKISCTLNTENGFSRTKLFLLYDRDGNHFLRLHEVEYDAKDEIAMQLSELIILPYEKQVQRHKVIVSRGERKTTSEATNNKKLKEQSDPTNDEYFEKFRNLLGIEERHKNKNNSKNVIINVSLSKVSESLLEISMSDLENRTLLVGNEVHVTKNGKNYHIGFVHETSPKVKVNFSSVMVAQHNDKDPYIIEFMPNSYPFKIMHRALGRLTKKEGLKRMLNPTNPGANILDSENTNDSIANLRLFNEKLNEQQIKAVRNIVDPRSAKVPYIVFGPPGTGKTVTLVEAILQTCRKLRTKILVCAPSNYACDLLTHLLMEQKKEDNVLNIFRMNAATRNFDTITSPLVKKASKGKIHFPLRNELEEFQIIVCTPITAGRLDSFGISENHFTHVFIDEAGQAMEPECVVPLAGIAGEKCRVVLAGDCKQLGPVIFSSTAADGGLGISLLERLQLHCDLYANGNDDHIIKLINNYRSHKDIIKVPNELYYEDELQVCADKTDCEKFCKWTGLSNPGFPIIFNGIQGKEMREGNDPSYFNLYEVSAIIEYVAQLLSSESGISVVPGDIGIIFLYCKQVEKIRLRLSLHDNWSDIKVGTVEEFQGQERPIILISTVRSNVEVKYGPPKSLGFLMDEKRFNVAVTRAKSLLIVVGNSRTLETATGWKELLQHCKENGGYKGIPLI